jgi:hypothetical protein
LSDPDRDLAAGCCSWGGIITTIGAMTGATTGAFDCGNDNDDEVDEDQGAGGASGTVGRVTVTPSEFINRETVE